MLHEEPTALIASYHLNVSDEVIKTRADHTELPLDDPDWYPRTWTDFINLLRVYGHQRLRSIPTDGLKAQLVAVPLGNSIVDTVLDQFCHNMADLLIASASTGDMGPYHSRLDSIQRNLLMATATNYLRTSLIKSDPVQASTSWIEVGYEFDVSDVERMKVIAFRDIAESIQDARVRNCLLRHLPRDCTLHDLVNASKATLLRIPNLGPKNLDILKQELHTILSRLPKKDSTIATQTALLEESALPKSDLHASIVGAQDCDWQALCRNATNCLTAREIEILELSFGRYGQTETLEQIGQRLNLTRQRIRQIKVRSGHKFAEQVSAEMAARAFHNLAASRLEAAGVPVSVTNLLNAPNDPRIVSANERWMLSWFDTLYGDNWYTKVLLADKSNVSNNSQEIVDVISKLTVVQFLQHYSYRPLSLEEALTIAQSREPSASAADLRIQLESHPEIRLFAYGDLQIGHVSWRWFAPQRARTGRRVEWALRLINTAASPVEIAQVMRDRLGVLEASAFMVADACEKEPEVFFELDGRYGLAIWQGTGVLRGPLTNLLADGPLLLTDLADRWITQYGSPFDSELILATLHTNQEYFHTVKPLCWARKDTTSVTTFDPTSLTFEALMPTL
jgi:hypothetical protein